MSLTLFRLMSFHGERACSIRNISLYFSTKLLSFVSGKPVLGGIVFLNVVRLSLSATK